MDRCWKKINCFFREIVVLSNKRGDNLLIYLLLTLLVLIWLIAYIFSKKDIVSAPCLLSLCYIICVIVSIVNMDLWNFHIGELTVWVILLGISSFCIGYFFIYYFFIKTKKNLKMTSVPSERVHITNKAIYGFILIELIGIALIYNFLQSFPGDSIFEKIYYYRFNIFFDNSSEDRLPSYMQFFIDFSISSSFIIIYKVILDYYLLKKWNIKCVCSIFLAMMISMMTGGRGSSIFLVVGIVIMSYVFYMKKHNWIFELNLKKIILLISIPVVGILIFSMLQLLVGRDFVLDSGNISQSISNIWQSISMYLGAQIKLLDLYLYTDYKQAGTYYSLIGAETFSNLYIWLGTKLGINSWIVSSVGSGFRADNGVELGNVYTMFKFYVADFGLFGVSVLSGIMGGFFGYIYFRIKYIIFINKKNVDYILIAYSYIFISVALSFFTDWFYNYFFSVITIKTILYWKIFEWLFINKKYIINKNGD